MSRDETALTRWIVYCQTHSVLQLDHRVFTPILDKLRNNRILHTANSNNSSNSNENAVIEGSGVRLGICSTRVSICVKVNKITNLRLMKSSSDVLHK